MVGCWLALTTDCRLYSSNCRQCCLGPVPAGWDACCCRCTIKLAGGSIRRSHRSCISINSLLGHVTLGCAIALAGGDMDAVHNWSQYTHWTWHCTTSSDLLEYHTTHRGTVHRWTCMPWDMVTLLTRAVSLNPLKQTWYSTSSDLIECYAMHVCAVCHWMCSLLDTMLSGAVLVDLLEEPVVHSSCHCLESMRRHYHVFCVIESSGTVEWPYHFGLSCEAIDGAVDAFMRTICCTHWENTHLPYLCTAPSDLLKGHTMLYVEGSVAIANTVTMYMQWRSCCFPPYWYVIGLFQLFISVSLL